MREEVMKTVALTVIALVASTTYAITQGRTTRDLEPSLRIFDTVPTPMPKLRDVTFYQALPNSQGALVMGMGNSAWVKGWFSQMRQLTPKFVTLDERLRQDLGVYADTVREEGEKVLNATANLRKSLSDLDRATHGKVQDLLAEYNDEVKATRVARAEFEAATKRAEEADYLLDASDASAKECNLLLDLSKKQADKAALLDRMQRARAFLDTAEKAIRAMSAGPEAAAAYVTGEATALTMQAAKTVILDTFFANTRETLFQLGSEIEAIEKALNDLKCRQQKSALRAAKSNLEARMIQVLVAFGKILDHRAKAWRVIDRLGTLQDPQSGRKLPFFMRLQAYNSQVNLMGRTVFDSVDDYLDFLGKEPLSRGTLLLKSVQEDMEVVEREKEKRDPSGKWTRVASGTKMYFGVYTKWYDGEVKRGQRVLADLREGRHLEFVDRMMATATKELGGTVSYAEIIR
jgi:hypothetical protein